MGACPCRYHKGDFQGISSDFFNHEFIGGNTDQDAMGKFLSPMEGKKSDKQQAIEQLQSFSQHGKNQIIDRSPWWENDLRKLGMVEMEDFRTWKQFYFYYFNKINTPYF